MPEQLIFNSYYRSANVFLSFLSNRLGNFSSTTNHDPEIYSDKTKKQVVMFRNPYDCIPSLIVKRRVDSDVQLPTFSNPFGVEIDITRAAQEYIYYTEKAKENFDNIYVGHFETMIKDPIYEIKKIAKFFNLQVATINSSFEEIYEEIRQSMLSQPGPVNAENLLTSHDGHMPREKTEERLAVEQYVKNCDLSIMKECYDAYLNMEYTKL